LNDGARREMNQLPQPVGKKESREGRLTLPGTDEVTKKASDVWATFRRLKHERDERDKLIHLKRSLSWRQ